MPIKLTFTHDPKTNTGKLLVDDKETPIKLVYPEPSEEWKKEAAKVIADEIDRQLIEDFKNENSG